VEFLGPLQGVHAFPYFLGTVIIDNGFVDLLDLGISEFTGDIYACWIDAVKTIC